MFVVFFPNKGSFFLIFIFYKIHFFKMFSPKNRRINYSKSRYPYFKKKTWYKKWRKGRNFKKSYRKPMRNRFQPARMTRVPNLTIDEKAYIDCVTNPFGNVGDGLQLNRSARALDSSGLPTIAATVTCSASFSGATGQRCIAKVCRPYYNGGGGCVSNIGIRVGYSAAGAGTPTNSTSYYWLNGNGTLTGLIDKYRVISVGLKCYGVAGDANDVGTMTAGNSSTTVEYAAATWWSYGDHAKYFPNRGYPLKTGITCRWAPIDNTDFEFVSVQTIAAPCGYSEGRMPAIYVEDFAAATTLRFEAIMHLEVYVGQRDIFVPLTPSPVSSRWQIILAIVTHPDFAPEVTTSHSFKGLFDYGGKMLDKLIRWIRKHDKDLVGVSNVLHDL